MFDYQKPLDLALTAAVTAGERVQELRRNNGITPVSVARLVRNYEDGQPVGAPYERNLKKTNADLLSQTTFKELIRKEFPEFLILSEEEYSKYDTIPRDTPYFVFDPIDGTIHLEKGSPQWTINVAICLNGTALAGVVVVPDENKVYVGSKGLPSRWAACDMQNHWKELASEERTRNELIVSKCAALDIGGEDDPVPASIINANGLLRTHTSGSAYRYIEIATGAVDLIVHGAGNFLWDKAAAQVVIEGAGGALVELPWHSLSSDGENILVDIPTAPPMSYHREALKDEGHIVLSRNSIAELSTLRIPKSLDRRKLWKFVIS